MKTVFLVTQCEYDDYHIVGVFTTRSKAEQYVRDHPTLETPGIEEFLLDTPTPDPKRVRFIDEEFV